MPKNRARPRVVLAVCVLAVAGACVSGPGEDRDADMTARHLAGTVPGWDEEPAELVAGLSDGAEVLEIARGTLSQAGRVDVTLPETVRDDLVSPLGGAVSCAEVEVDPVQAGVAVLFSLNVVRDDQALAAIAQASSAAATFPLPSEAGATRVYRWYADRDATAHGTCVSSSGGYRYEHRWSLNLARGWNVVVETIVELSEGSEIRESRTGAVPEGTSWYFLDVMEPPP